MRDFKNGKIYSIRCFSNLDLIYIGSTCQQLSRRWTDHRKDSKNNNSLIYKIIRENGGIDNFYIELVENYPCDSFEQLTKREGEVMREIGNKTMNALMAGTFAGKTQSEYDKERSKTEHRIKYKQIYSSKYREEHVEELKSYMKDWYEKNKEKQLEDAKQNYHKNKQTISENKKLNRVDCECGSNVRFSDLNKHKKSQKHISFTEKSKL